MPTFIRFRRATQLVAVTCMVCMLLIASGCSLLPSFGGHGAPDEGQAGQVIVRANVAGVRASDLDGSIVTLVMRKDGRDRTQELEVVDSEVVAHLSNVLPGKWEVILSLADSSQTVIYQAKGEVSVTPGGTASVQLVLKPVPGILEVTVDPSSHPELAAAKNGRIYVNPGGYSTMSTIEGGLLKGQKELAPGTYDFSVALYGDSFYASDRLYESPYTTITITPGRITSVVWSPITGICSVDGRVDAPPAAPQNVQLVKVAQGLAIAWQPTPDPEGDLDKYRIYMRQDPFSEFDLIYELSADKSGYMYPESELNAGVHVEVAVTAVDEGGQESERSPVVSINY